MATTITKTYDDNFTVQVDGTHIETNCPDESEWLTWDGIHTVFRAVAMPHLSADGKWTSTQAEILCDAVNHLRNAFNH